MRGSYPNFLRGYLMTDEARDTPFTEDTMNVKGIGPFNVATDLIFTIIIVIGLILLPGCAATPQKAGSPVEFNEEAPFETPSLPVYYDFEDISVPPELKLDQKRSFIYETLDTKNGVLVFKGRVNAVSLVSFFKNNMPRDNWVFLNSYKYNDYILNFKKNNKICSINLHDGLFNTIVEIRLGYVREDMSGKK